MKRDMNLVRDLLLFYESDCSIPHPTEDAAAADEHIIMLIEAGLLAGEVSHGTLGNPRTADPVDLRLIPGVNCQYSMFPLTWAGHDFLTAARDQKIWNKAVGAMRSMTFKLAKEYLETIVRESVGMRP